MGARQTYYADVFDMQRFVDWCIEREQMHLLLPNQVALNKLARQQKNLLNISGVAAVLSVKEPAEAPEYPSHLSEGEEFE